MGKMRNNDGSRRAGSSRRTFVKSGAGLITGGAVAQLLPGAALAQSIGATEPDSELRRLQTQGRILLKSGVVLTLDPQVGDFAQADVLIEEGKIRAVRPNIDLTSDTAAIIDAT